MEHPRLAELREIPNGGDRILAFADILPRSTGKLAPLALRDWQRNILRELFGTMGPDGRRRYRAGSLWLPRKNGKSELVAVIGLYALLLDGERGAEVYSCASTRDQASRIYRAMRSMALASDELRDVLDFSDVHRRIRVIGGPLVGNEYRALSSDAGGQHGLNASVVLFDELHVSSQELFDVMKTSQGARDEPIFYSISTAGIYDPQSVAFQEYVYARDVRDRRVDAPEYHATIYEASPEDDWTAPATWAKANPALGDFLSLDALRVACDEAKRIPSRENSFKQLHLNIWPNASTRWISSKLWNDSAADVNREALRGRRCFVGLDLSATRDLTAVVCIFPNDDGSVDVLPFFFCPEEPSDERASSDRYRDWVRGGVLISTPGKTVDYSRVRVFLNDLAGEFEIVNITFDGWQAHMLTRLLAEDGFDMVPLRQGFASLSAPSKLFEKLVAEGKLRHPAHPILDWNVDNVVIELDAAGNIKPSKAKSVEKIDGVLALINALDSYSRTPQEPASYEVYVL